MPFWESRISRKGFYYSGSPMTVDMNKTAEYNDCTITLA